MLACSPSPVNHFRAVVERHDFAAGWSVLRWHHLRLHVPLAANLPEGHEVAWSIPPDQVRLLSNSGRPIRDDDTPFEVRLIELVTRQQEIQAIAEVVAWPDERLTMTANAEVARSHGVVEGALLTLRLRGQNITVQPAGASDEVQPA